jgi:outer membrane lipoprotein-sorting protein
MFKKIFLFFFGATLCISFSRGAWTQTYDEDIDKIENLEKEVKSCESKYTVDFYEKGDSAENEVKMYGTVWFKSPSSWRIETYNKETDEIMLLTVCDGKSLWHYNAFEEGGKKATKKSVEALSFEEQNDLVEKMTGNCPMFARILSNIKSSITDLKEDNEKQTWEARILPNDYSSQNIPFEYDGIRAVFSKADGLLRELEIDYNGKPVNILIFYDTSVNIPVEDSRFIFEPPKKDVEIEEAP